MPVTSIVHLVSVTPKTYMQPSPVICSPHPSSAVLSCILQSSPIPCKARQSRTGPTSHVQGPPVKYRARPSSSVTRKIAQPETPAVPASPSWAPFQLEQSVPFGPKDGSTGCLGTLGELPPHAYHMEPPCLAVPL